MDLYTYWQLFLRRVPLVLFLTVAGSLIGLWLALTLPPVYRTHAVLIVESGQIPDELASSTVQTGDIEALEIIRQQIISRDVLLDLSNELGIFDDQPNIGADERVANLRNRITFETRGGQVRRGARDATVVVVGFQSDRPDLTANTVNALVTLILQTNVEMRTSVARQTLDFFDQEVTGLETQLSELNRQILNFQENNLEALPDSLEFRRSRQASLQERIVQLDRQQAAIFDRRALLVTMFETTGTITGESGEPSRPGRVQLRPAEQLLAELQNEYASLLPVLSENNPRIVLLRTQIESAQAAVDRLPPLATSDGNQRTDQATMLDIQLADLDAQVSYIEDQKQAANEQLADIQRTIQATPSNAVTLSSLERSFANAQEQYNQAVANRARAETGSMIESLAQGQRISVVEQAVPPERPSSPNRPVVAIAGFAGGMFLAMGIALLLELLNRKIRRPEDIEKALGVEVFATLPYITTTQETLRQVVRKFIGFAMLGGFILGGLYAVDRFVQPLQPFVDRILGSLF